MPNSEKTYAKLVVNGDWSDAEGATLIVAQSVEISAGATMNISKSLKEIRTERLVMNPGSVIRLNPELQEFQLKSSTSTIVGKCTISGNGLSPGGNGVSIKIYFGLATIDKLTISALGAKGATGDKGPTGHKGSNANCDLPGGQHHAHNGYPGGKGGTGGRGGRGGEVLVVLKKGSLKPTLLKIATQGGVGGSGGRGGNGGPGGDGKQCLWHYYAAGKIGPLGPGGDPGPEGATTVPLIIEVDNFTEFKNLPKTRPL